MPNADTVPAWLQPGREIAVINYSRASGTVSVSTSTIFRVTATLAIDTDGRRHKVADLEPGPRIRTETGAKGWPSGHEDVVPSGSAEHRAAAAEVTARPVVKAAQEAAHAWTKKASEPVRAEDAATALEAAAAALRALATAQRAVIAARATP